MPLRHAEVASRSKGLADCARGPGWMAYAPAVVRGLGFVSLLLALGIAGSPAFAEPLARLVNGQGTRLIEIEGTPTEEAEITLAAGLRVFRFTSSAEVEWRDGRVRRIQEICEARLEVRPGALYVLEQELVSVRGRRAWRHILSSGVRDDAWDRWVGECVCRPVRMFDSDRGVRFEGP